MNKSVEALGPPVTKERIPFPDRPRGLFAGFCAGLLVMTVGVSVALTASGPGFGSLGLAVIVAIVGAPVWFVCAFVFGGPIWILAERCGLRAPWAAALLGAATVGGVWFAYLSWSTGDQGAEAWRWILAASSIGAVSGAAAGVATWWGGYRWGQPK